MLGGQFPDHRILDAFDEKAARRSLEESLVGFYSYNSRDRLSYDSRREYRPHLRCIAAAANARRRRLVESRSTSPLRRRLHLFRISAVVVCDQRKNGFGGDFGTVPAISLPASCLLRDDVGNSAGEWRISPGSGFHGACALRFTDSFATDSPACRLPLYSGSMGSLETITRKSCGERFDLIASILVERSELNEEDRPLREAFSKRKLMSAGPSRARRDATRQRESRAAIVGSWMAPPQLGLWSQARIESRHCRKLDGTAAIWFVVPAEILRKK